VLLFKSTKSTKVFRFIEVFSLVRCGAAFLGSWFREFPDDIVVVKGCSVQEHTSR
jgi:hypothetical protein